MERYDIRSEVMFIPDKVVVGKFNANEQMGCSRDYRAGFVTCRFKHEKWVSPTVFERLCGFKPNVQRDAEKELRKAIENAVDEIDNVPVAGFKIAGFHDNIYGYCSKDYDVVGDVILEDPRGFCIGVTLEEMFSLLDKAGGNLKGHAFESLKLAYGWGPSMSLHLVSDADKWYEKAKAESQKKAKALRSIKSVKKAELVVGKAYKTFSPDIKKVPIPVGTYIYMGIHDTYSIKCHKNALKHGTYSHAAFIEDEAYGRGDLGRSSTSGKMVFYHVGAKWTGKPWSDIDRQLPYYFRADISQIFESEVEIPKAEMHNSSLLVTCENIKADMEKCLLFNKLSLQPLGYADYSRSLFETCYGYCNTQGLKLIHSTERHPYDTFPAELMSSPIFWSPAKSDWIKLQTYSANRSQRTSDWVVKQSRQAPANSWSFSYHTRREELKSLSYDKVYDLMKPQYMRLKLENGHELPEEQACHFADPRAEEALSHYF